MQDKELNNTNNRNNNRNLVSALIILIIALIILSFAVLFSQQPNAKDENKSSMSNASAANSAQSIDNSGQSVVSSSSSLSISTSKSSSSSSTQIIETYSNPILPDLKFNYDQNSFVVTNRNGDNESKFIEIKSKKSGKSINVNYMPRVATGYAGIFPCGTVIESVGDFEKVKFYQTSGNKTQLYIEYLFKTALIRKNDDVFKEFVDKYYSDLPAAATKMPKDKIDFCGVNIALNSVTRTTLKGADKNEAFVNITFSGMDENGVKEFDTVIKTISGFSEIEKDI